MRYDDGAEDDKTVVNVDFFVLEKQKTFPENNP